MHFPIASLLAPLQERLETRKNRSEIVTRGFSGLPNSILALELSGGARGWLCEGARGVNWGDK